MRFPRSTTRRLMVLVALTAGILAWTSNMLRLSASYRQRAIQHWWQYQPALITGSAHPQPPESDLNRWHGKMAEKYMYASRHPWIPIGPDPPRPK